jgi:hypothetical protein
MELFWTELLCGKQSQTGSREKHLRLQAGNDLQDFALRQ